MPRTVTGGEERANKEEQEAEIKRSRYKGALSCDRDEMSRACRRTIQACMALSELHLHLG